MGDKNGTMYAYVTFSGNKNKNIKRSKKKKSHYLYLLLNKIIFHVLKYIIYMESYQA